MKNLLEVQKSCCLEYTMSLQGKDPLSLDIVVCVNYLKGKKGENG
jgi:hypothetical protein